MIFTSCSPFLCCFSYKRFPSRMSAAFFSFLFHCLMHYSLSFLLRVRCAADMPFLRFHWLLFSFSLHYFSIFISPPLSVNFLIFRDAYLGVDSLFLQLPGRMNFTYFQSLCFTRLRPGAHFFTPSDEFQRLRAPKGTWLRKKFRRWGSLRCALFTWVEFALRRTAGFSRLV